MKLTENEKEFLKKNRNTLSSLFEKRLAELEKLISSLDTNLSSEEFKIQYIAYQTFISELKNWLRTIKVLSKENKPDSGV